jgi:hypothetical protein
MAGKWIMEAIGALAAAGLIYDTGKRRKGQIVWACTTGEAAAAKARKLFKDDPGVGRCSTTTLLGQPRA